MILDAEGIKRLEQLKHNEEILFKVLGYLTEMFAKNNIGYYEEIEIYKNKLGLTDDDLEYLCIRDYDLEDELLGDE